MLPGVDADLFGAKTQKLWPAWRIGQATAPSLRYLLKVVTLLRRTAPGQAL